jgi:HEAT repeat protein
VRPAAAVAGPSERLAAVLALPADAGGRRRLLEAVLDVSPRVAVAALERLAKVGGAAEAARIRGLLFDLDLAVIPAAARALVALGDRECLEPALARLRSGSNDARARAALVLREIAAPESAEALRSALGDPLANVRRLAVEALARLPDDGANLAAVLQLTPDPDETVRLALVRAVATLAREPEPLLARFLEDPAVPVRQELARRLCLLSAAAAALLVADADADVRAQAMWSLAEHPRRDLLEAVIARLDDPDWRVRRAACRALGAARARRAFEPLVARLLDGQAIVHDAALRALRQIFGVELPQALAGAARGERDARSRRALVYAIGQTAAAAELVLPFAHDPDGDVRLAVIHVLSAHPAAGGSDALRALASDPNPAVANAAELALETGSPG